MTDDKRRNAGKITSIMFRVEYYCPSQGNFWQPAKGLYRTFIEAMRWAQVVKPGRGHARVIGPAGDVLYQV